MAPVTNSTERYNVCSGIVSRIFSISQIVAVDTCQGELPFVIAGDDETDRPEYFKQIETLMTTIRRLGNHRLDDYNLYFVAYTEKLGPYGSPEEKDLCGIPAATF